MPNGSPLVRQPPLDGQLYQNASHLCYNDVHCINHLAMCPYDICREISYLTKTTAARRAEGFYILRLFAGQIAEKPVEPSWLTEKEMMCLARKKNRKQRDEDQNLPDERLEELTLQDDIQIPPSVDEPLADPQSDIENLPLPADLEKSKPADLTKLTPRDNPPDQPSLLVRCLSAVWHFLKRIYFGAANGVYDYFYFVGIQLLRSTRSKRRHLILGFRMFVQSQRRRRKDHRHLLRNRLHAFWRGLTAPLRALRERYRDFRRDLHNARLYGSPGRAVLVCLRLAGFLLYGLWRGIKYLLNYAAPVAGIALFYMTVTYFNGQTLALRVEYNGVDMGYISNEGVFNQAENDMKGRIINETYIKPDDIIPKFELSVIESESLLTVDQLTNQLIRASGNELELADGLYIQDRFISAVADGDALLLYMNEMLEKYRTPELDETAQIQFVKKIQIKRGLYPTTSVVPLEEVQTLLNSQERGEKRYTVVAGDDGLTIAAKNGIAFKELKLLNPEVDIRLMPGDSLLISQSVPYLGVQVKTTLKYKEEIPFRVEQETDPDQEIGYTKTIQEGKEGLRQVTEEVTWVDGIEVSRDVVSRDPILIEPVNRIMIVGGNKPLQVIPSTSDGKVSSGAFAWPTTGGSITTPFLGYSGHTGSDIQWGGCTGAPVYASADGVVVAAGWGGSYGNRVIIEHGGGFRTLYAHCSKLAIGLGETVKQGDTIGYIGRTGNTTGPHVHFEIRVNGVPVNAAPYLYG